MKNIFKYTLIAIILFFGFWSFLISNQIAGIRAFTVMSGSMEPAISTGALVITKKTAPSDLREKDIVTFIRPEHGRQFITHRIEKINIVQDIPMLITKGDNNSTTDSWVIAAGSVVGKVEYVIPYLGYLITFGKSKLGLVLFVLIPAFFILYSEFANIYRLVKINRKEKFNPIDIVPIVFVSITFALIHFMTISPTFALLSDSATLSANKFTIVLNPASKPCTKDINVEISGNGASSQNEVNITSKCDIEIIQKNDLIINNNVSITQLTGEYESNQNTSTTKTQ